jgi:hypothetical protein
VRTKSQWYVQKKLKVSGGSDAKIYLQSKWRNCLLQVEGCGCAGGMLTSTKLIADHML